MSFSRVLRVLLLVSSLPAVGQSVSVNGSVCCSDVAVADYTRVFEHVRWQADGTNHEFDLSRTPAAQFPIHIFESGIELTPGVDYTLQGNVGTLTGRAVEYGGEDLQAAYMTASTQSAGASTGSTRAEAGRVLGNYLQRSLERELVEAGSSYSPAAAESSTVVAADVGSSPSLSRGSGIFAAGTGGAVSKDPKPRDREPESFRMLSEAISRSETVPRHNSSGKLRKRYVTAADGLEGFGDDAVSSPYDILALRPGGLQQALNQMDVQSGNSSSRSPRRPSSETPASLRLLEQRLAAAPTSSQ